MIAAKVANALALDYPRERLQVDRRLRRLRRRHRRARPRGRRRPRPRAAAAAARSPPRTPPPSGPTARSSPSPTPTASGRPTPCAAWSRPSPTRRSATSAARSASSTPSGDNLEGAYWRYEMAVREMESALAGVTAGNGAIYAVRRDAYLPLARLRQPRPLLPLRASPSAACARSTRPAARAEEKMVPTIEGEFARKRRMMVGLWDIVVGEGMLLAARLPAALRLRARLAPAAALPDARSCTCSSSLANLALLGQGWVYIVTLVVQLALLAAAAARPPLPARAAAHRPLLRDDDRLDRRRPLGPLPPRRVRALGEGGGNAMMPPRRSTSLDRRRARPGRRSRRCPAARGDRDQARQPRPGHLPPAPGRPRRRASSRC